MEHGANGELSHPTPGSQTVQGVDPSPGIGMAVSQSELTLGVKDVGVQPHIGVGQPVAPHSGVGEDVEGTSEVPAGGADQRETTCCHPLPARIPELAGPCKRLAKQFFGPGRVPPCQLDLPRRACGHGM